jgi:topoisomerase-4 subunit A
MPSVEPLMRQNFLEYASKVIIDRAIPHLADGCKPVQRRILHTLSEMDDGKFIKVANVIGETMKLHPHGDAAIGDALVVLANKGLTRANENLSYFLERQGNFGNILTGDSAAAPRYIECRLTPLAKETLFNPALTRFLPSYDGRKDEPEYLPAKLPVVLMLGTEGIAVGMATTILSHNLPELLRAQIAILRDEKFQCLPDFPQGGLMDASDYADGRGKVRLRARIEKDGDKKVVIREIPFGTTVDSLIESIEAAAEKGKVKISNIEDRTGADVEILLTLQRGVYADEVIPQLFAYTGCEQSINSNIIVIRDGKPAEVTVSDLLRDLTERLKAVIKAELEHELAQLTDKQHALTLEQVFIENRVYKRIEEATTEEAVVKAVHDGMKPFSARFVRPMTDADVARLLEIRIKRISAYDINKNRKDIADVLAAIQAAQNKLKRLTATTIAWLEALVKKYGNLWPRRTQVQAFQAIDKKAVANANIRLGYDQATGFFGSQVKSGDRELKVSEYDKIIAIFQDGRYRIMSPPDKTLFEGKLIHLDLFDEKTGFNATVIYRDKAKCAWGKAISITSFIKDKEYELIKDCAGRIDYLGPASGTAVLVFQHAGRGEAAELRIDLAKIEPAGVATRGAKLSDRAVARVGKEK